MQTLQNIIKRREELKVLDAQARKAFTNHQKSFSAEMAEISAREAILLAGLDLAKIDAAKQIVSVVGLSTQVRHGYYADQNRLQVRQDAVAEALADIANGAPRLRRLYFGVKNYDHFGDQRADCEYGLSPRHGSIVFKIGLRPDVRNRLDLGDSLTADEIEAALYLLSVLPSIEAAEAKRTAT